MSGQIDDIAALEAWMGKTPGSMQLKVIDHLDSGAQRWLAASPLMFAGFESAANISISLAGGAPGFVETIHTGRIRLPKKFLDNPDLASEERGFGGLCLVPTLGETLRINGRVVAVNADAIEIQIQECYVHCAKALIRSDFWKATPQTAVPPDTAQFLTASRFMALATSDINSHADVSPKGDPAGTMIQSLDGVVTFADRPGNRRADSFRNILTQPAIAIAALIPGILRVALLTGKAGLTNDPHLRERFVVHGKIPTLVTRIETPEIVLY